MIWIVFFTLLVLAAGYVMIPFLSDSEATPVAALGEARGQRQAVDLDEAEGRLSPQAAGEARDALDRRILVLLDDPHQSVSGARLKSLAMGIVPAVLLLGGVGIYSQIGQPAYQPLTFADYQAQQVSELPDTLEELVVELRARLEADPNPPADGYVLLARSYLRLGAVEAGLAAYETAIEISGGAAELVAERDRVIQILQDRSAAPQIDPDAQARIETMSPDEQAAMIGNMVEGLAARLEQDPNDLQGWLRLIRARIVMGDVAQARADLTTAQETFPIETEEGQMLQRLAVELLPPSTDIE